MIEDGRRIRIPVRAAIAGTAYDNTDVYRSFDGPILQLHGAHDALRPATTALDRSALFRHGRTELWQDSGHAPFDDEPERFVAAVQAFCEAAAR